MPGFNRLRAAIDDPMMRTAARGFLGRLRADLVGRADGTTLEIEAARRWQHRLTIGHLEGHQPPRTGLVKPFRLGVAS